MNFKVWFAAFSFCLFAVVTNSAGVTGTAEEIKGLAEKAKLTSDTFMRQSFRFRMEYEYDMEFPTEQARENLRQLATRAGYDLQAIAEKQEAFKRQIENYQTNDWEQRYGSTGLWRKLSADLYTTILSKCEIDFYLALSARQPERNKILQDILTEINSLELTQLPAGSQPVKAKTLALLAQTEPAYKSAAEKEYNVLTIRSDMKHSTALRISIEKIKLLGETQADDLDNLTETISKSACADDIELALSLAFLQRRSNRPEAFKKTVNLFPQTEDFIGSLVLSNLSNRLAQGQLTEQSLQQTSVFEAELAAEAIWKDETQDHKKLLERLLSAEKFRTPLILYVGAKAFAKSSPVKTVELLIRASNLHQLQRSDRLDIQPGQIAEQAARVAYNLFVQNSVHCPIALEAFENYCAIAGRRIDEQLEYLYAVTANQCGQSVKSTEILEKISHRPTGKWRNKAALELIAKQIRQNQRGTKKQQDELINRLNDLIRELSSRDRQDQQIRAEAIELYCELILSKNDVSAQEISNIVTEADVSSNPRLNIFKAKALQREYKLFESAGCLAKVAEANDPACAEDAMYLLSNVIDEIEQVQAKLPAGGRLTEDCENIAEFCHRCLDNSESGLLLAETMVLAAATKGEKLASAEKLIDKLEKEIDYVNVDFLRCRARLLTEQAKFRAAARLWAKICTIRNAESPSANQRTWKWWRAKFYELYCWNKLAQTKKEDVLHTVEVLENSLSDIAPLWAEKFNDLKKSLITTETKRVTERH